MARVAQVLIVLQNQGIGGGIQPETSGAETEKANHYQHTKDDCLRIPQNDSVEKKSYWVMFRHNTMPA